MQPRTTYSQGSSSSIERRRRAMQGVACTTLDLNIRFIQWFNMTTVCFLHSSSLRSLGKQSEKVCSIAKKNQVAGRTTQQGYEDTYIRSSYFSAQFGSRTFLQACIPRVEHIPLVFVFVCKSTWKNGVNFIIRIN